MVVETQYQANRRAYNDLLQINYKKIGCKTYDKNKRLARYWLQKLKIKINIKIERLIVLYLLYNTEYVLRALIIVIIEKKSVLVLITDQEDNEIIIGLIDEIKAEGIRKWNFDT